MRLEADPADRNHWRDRGVSLAWQPFGAYGEGRADGLTRSESASMSRTLRRLEARGLVHRYNTISGDPPAVAKRRTTDITLTPAGRKLAEKLADENWPEDWRLTITATAIVNR
jgi:DNA-binding HxlR family transcriptional regulator